MCRFGSCLLTLCIVIFYLDQVLKTNAYNEEKYNSRYYYPKASKMRNNPDSYSVSKGKGVLGKYKYKTDFQSPNSYKRSALKQERDSENSMTENPPKNEPEQKKISKKPIPARTNETEAEKAERIHRTFEKLLTFVEIVGQVDNYVSTKWKNLVRTVSNLYDEEDEDIRLGQKFFSSCPTVTNET